MVANRISKKSDLHVAIIGDEETVSGFCLAGAGMRDGNGVTNFLVVDAKTRREDIEEAFKTFVERPDVAIVIINQPVAEKIRHVVRKSSMRHRANNGIVISEGRSRTRLHVSLSTPAGKAFLSCLGRDFGILNY
ncbi:V-type proton ATPase subunit F [Perkinsus olseni]|uniref:V-type proton ATPase subunit F n=1 Tax=Perkinsus olseni TaxID=32597 RepID=A0A7J6REC8_PEROL|nr:V-type proton ATPase subunit F [Perkinsus olseni]